MDTKSPYLFFIAKTKIVSRDGKHTLKVSIYSQPAFRDHIPMGTTPNPNSANEIQVLKEIYGAINRNYFSSVIKYFDADIVRVEPEGFPSSGTYRGVIAMMAHFQQARDTWAEGSCEPEQFVSIKDCLIAFCRVHVRLENKTEWIDGQVADLFKFKDGRVIYMHSFVDKAQALQYASGARS